MAEPSFTTVDTELSVDLHPSALRNVSTSVKELLQELVLTYRPEYSGVVMGYRNVQIISRAAPVHTFFPYSHVKVSAKLLILEMRNDQIIDGIVHQVGVEYIGLKVLGGLTAVIHKDELQHKFEHSPALMGWRCKSGGHETIKSGCSVRFSLKRIDTAQDKFILVGSASSDAFCVVLAGQKVLQQYRAPTSISNGATCHADRQQDIQPLRNSEAAVKGEGVAEVARRKSVKKKKRKAAEQNPEDLCGGGASLNIKSTEAPQEMKHSEGNILEPSTSEEDMDPFMSDLAKSYGVEPEGHPKSAKKQRTSKLAGTPVSTMTPPRLGNPGGESALGGDGERGAVEKPAPKKKKRKKSEENGHQDHSALPNTLGGSGAGMHSSQNPKSQTARGNSNAKKEENVSLPKSKTVAEVTQVPVNNHHKALHSQQTPASEPKKKKKKSQKQHTSAGQGDCQAQVGAGVQKKTHTRVSEGDGSSDRKKKKKKNKSSE